MLISDHRSNRQHDDGRDGAVECGESRSSSQPFDGPHCTRHGPGADRFADLIPARSSAGSAAVASGDFGVFLQAFMNDGFEVATDGRIRRCSRDGWSRVIVRINSAFGVESVAP